MEEWASADFSRQPYKTTIMKKIIILTAITAASVSCGENESERAQRESAAADRRTLLEYQRQENIQRQADRDQRAVEAGVQVFDILTR
jgi:hypothetical protein